MEIVDTWTGRTACTLQAAMRSTNEQFAEHLGVGVRTVAAWHKSPAITPRAEMQAVLDTAYERAGQAVHLRFARLSQATAGPVQAQALRVAIAVVVRRDEVLLVCRRGDSAISWQFPAGIVKPGIAPQSVAAQETLAETGIHCLVRAHLGSRLHPLTGAQCEYYLCDYVHGEAGNQDVLENADVVWAPRAGITRFIPAEKIYPPIMEALA